MNPVNSTFLDQVASIVVKVARDELVPRFAKVKRALKADGSFLTEADLAVQHRLEHELKVIFPDAVFLAEEMTVEQQQNLLSENQAVWCLDPLDGTSNFAAGIPYFATSLSLIIAGEVKLAVVYNPVMDECFTGLEGLVKLNGEGLKLTSPQLEINRTTAIVDFKRLNNQLAAALASCPPFSSQRSFGGVALDWCWLAAGRAHLYLHGKQNIWDYSAGHFIFQQVGGFSSTLDGEELFTNKLVSRAAVGAVDEKLFLVWTNWLQANK